MLKPAILQTISALLIFLFLYTGTDKLLYHGTFSRAVYSSPLLGKYTALVSWGVPLAELLAVILLVVPGWRYAGFLLSSALMFLFTLYVAYMMAFIPDLPCNCGGVIASIGWGTHLFLNIFFLLISLLATAAGKRAA